MIDFDGTLNDATSSTLGDEVPLVYLPAGGDPVPDILGVFTRITAHTFGEEGEPEANITVATLGLQVSQLPALPAQDDGVRIGTESFVVKDVDFDGLGWAYLDLGLQ